jgi:ribosomal protein S18 acetylase RimI-like enzyme
MSDREPTIRRDLGPGDLGEIIAHHGRLYGGEYGVDSTFEGHVASSVAAAGGRGFPRDGEGIWIVERGGAHLGSIALTDDGDATVRWFVLDRSLRGRGLGRRLIAEALELARSSGYERVCLETFSELTAAAHIYRGHGFELQSEQTGPRWGRERITYQRYELVLASRQARAQSRSSRSAGASARPFSVSA